MTECLADEWNECMIDVLDIEMRREYRQQIQFLYVLKRLANDADQ